MKSQRTGESHIIVTDDNGQFSASADWASHKHDTNEGKDSGDGVWFGTSEPDDTKGALPYDTYIIEGLHCESNKGFTLIPPFEIVVSRNNVTVDLGTLTDEYEQEISIHTTATSKDGGKEIEADKDVTIIDTVKLEGLEKGTKYRLVGWQMLQEENAELIINDKRVESDYTFTADSEEITIEVVFTFDASTLAGKSLVTYEELYDLSDEDEPFKVAEYKDIEDDGQTVKVKEEPEEPEVPDEPEKPEQPEVPKEPTKPQEPETPATPHKPTDSPKTGDSTNIALFAGLLALSGAGLTGAYFFKRRNATQGAWGV